MIVLGVGSGAYLPAVLGPNVVGCAAHDLFGQLRRFILLFSALLCAAIDPHFVPTQMDMWHMLENFRTETPLPATRTLATTTASMIHEFTSNQAPVHRRSVKGRSKNLPRNRMEGQLWLHKDYFHLTIWLMQGKAPRVSYEVNGNEYDKPYYLVDGIYPDWATLVKTVCNPNSEKTRRFAEMQEACRKDVERRFGVLQARWAIVRHPARTWSLKTMHEVMT
ncbi:hypothetical protein QYE76_062847 [Lolium multiflorum]|uniref:Uncharacterized protein n=1 Tax=Lolium multiflorum TaxID=4521 RepID=A0AAD8S6C7_LOLMU|nr:hypothetical protein QYE76_062847 [Lolium multiflorum]